MTKLANLMASLLPQILYEGISNIWLFLFRRNIYQAQREYKSIDEKEKFVHIHESMDYLKVAGANGALPQVYFEFGCHSGRTFSAAVRAAEFLKMGDAQFFAFDSFAGLPSTNVEEDGVFLKDTFNTSLRDFLDVVKKKGGIRLADENIIKEFYSESLTAKLQKTMPKVGVVHIDVDLYSSTVSVLKFIKSLMVRGTVLIFDDWYCFPAGSNLGEAKALKEFCEENPNFQTEPWKNYSPFERSFFVTSIP